MRRRRRLHFEVWATRLRDELVVLDLTQTVSLALAGEVAHDVVIHGFRLLLAPTTVA